MSANIHIEHLEDLIFQDQNLLWFYVEQIAAFLKGQQSSIDITIKFDGRPSIVYGRINDRIFVGTKSVFNKKTPKINFNHQHIEENHQSDNLELKEILHVLFDECSNLAFRDPINQADVLFKDNLKVIQLDRTKYVSFTPNIITYGVPCESELGQKILQAKIGVAFHTAYDSEFNVIGISNVIDNSRVCNFPVQLNFRDPFLSEEKLNRIIDDIRDTSPSMDIQSISSLLPFLKTFENFCLRNNINKTYERLVEYVGLHYDLRIKKLKTRKAQERLSNEKRTIVQKCYDFQHIIMDLQNFHQKIQHLKNIFLNGLNTYGDVNTFFHCCGKYETIGHEGFVVVDKNHNFEPVKLVDRQVFSRLNFIQYTNNETIQTIN